MSGRGPRGEIQKNIMIEVKDTGKGIPARDIQRIFSPFFTSKEKGTGLGLAMSKRLVEAHGGTIGLKSREGKGRWSPSFCRATSASVRARPKERVP